MRFALNNWDGPLTQSELAHVSPYNTRKHKGLPPGPIGNPGLASIAGRGQPGARDYLFYVANPCKSGDAHLPETDAEHQRNAAALQPGARGGRRQGPDELLMPALAGYSATRWATRARRRCTTRRSPRSGLDWRYVKLPVPPELFDETVRALPGSGYRGANVTIPHKVAGARPRRRGERRRPRRSGAANTLTFADDGAIDADNTDAGGLLDALGRARRGQRARARRGRRRRAPPPGRCARRAPPACPSGTARPTVPQALADGPRSRARGAPGRRTTCSSTRPRSASIPRPPRRTRSTSSPWPAPSRRRSWSTSSTAPAASRRSRPGLSARARCRGRPRGAGAAGRAELRDVDRADPLRST